MKKVAIKQNLDILKLEDLKAGVVVEVNKDDNYSVVDVQGKRYIVRGIAIVGEKVLVSKDRFFRLT